MMSHRQPATGTAIARPHRQRADENAGVGAPSPIGAFP